MQTPNLAGHCPQCGQRDSFSKHKPCWCLPCTKSLMQELEMPEATPAAWWTCTTRGYESVVLGIYYLGWPPGDSPSVAISYADDGQPILTVETWLWRVYAPDTPVWLELRWNPRQGQRISLQGLEHDSTDDALMRARRGLAVLNMRGRAGRNFDTGNYEEFGVEVARAWEEEKRRARAEGRRPSKAALAADMGYSKAALYNNLSKTGTKLQ